MGRVFFLLWLQARGPGEGLSVYSVLSNVLGALELAGRTEAGTLMMIPCHQCSASLGRQLLARRSSFPGVGLSRADTTLSYPAAHP